MNKLIIALLFLMPIPSYADIQQSIQQLSQQADDKKARLDYLASQIYAIADNQAKIQADEAAKLAKKPNAKIGMGKNQVINGTNWGNPLYINTTVTKYGKHEQWIYDNEQYLYFDNGKLTSMQQ